MRRKILELTISRIVNDLKDAKINDFFRESLRSSRRNGEKETFKMDLSIFRSYMLSTNNYGEAEYEILEILGIDCLLDIEFWQSFQEREAELLYSVVNSVNFALNQLPKILRLTAQHYVDEVRQGDTNLPPELLGKALLTVVLSENDAQFSSPLRLSGTLDSISEMYEVVSHLEFESSNDLIVLACDSGSDKSFDFLGAAKVMEEVRKIIIDVWDRVVFHRHRQASETLKLITESLPILERINQMRDAGTIEREQAELLSRKLKKGVTTFLEVGASIPELDNQANLSPRELMKPVSKLLVAPAVNQNVEEITEPDETDSEGESGELSDEENKVFEMLKKRVGKQGGVVNTAKVAKKKRSTKKK
jgi:hypothetical protein